MIGGKHHDFRPQPSIFSFSLAGTVFFPDQGPDGQHHREAALTQQELSKLLGAVATVRESPGKGWFPISSIGFLLALFPPPIFPLFPCVLFSGLAHCSTEALLPLMPHLLAHVTEGSQTSLLKSASAALKEDPGLDLGDWLNDGRSDHQFC